MLRRLALLLALVASPVRAVDNPNLLFITVDDLACSLGCYGDLLAKTPAIEQLAAEGVLFERAYCQIPMCNPSRASVMTGLRPDEIRVYDLDRHFRDEVPDARTISQRLGDAGWFSARVGKKASGLAPKTPFHQHRL